MKKIIYAIATFFVLAYATIANAAITDGKFGTGQMFDVQYYWVGNDLYASSFTRVFSSTGQLSVQDYTDMGTNNRYFAFFDSTVAAGEYGLAIYNSDGTVNRVLHDRGTITALGNDAIFYLGSGFYGTVIPTTQGYAFGDSATFTAMNTSPTAADVNNYTFATTTPLAAGQSASAPPPAPTPVYLSSITAAQTTQKTSAYAVTTGNNVELTILGNNNDVDITQLSDGNYLEMDVTGNSNVTDLTQSGTNLTRNFADIDIDGSTNTLTMLQDGASEKVLFLDIDGSFGTYNVTQQGTGTHYLNLSSLGDDADVTVLQEGQGNHSATVSLVNSGGNWVFNLTQSGDVNQLFSLPHNLSDNTVVSGDCYSGTCTMTINQQ